MTSSGLVEITDEDDIGPDSITFNYLELEGGNPVGYTEGVLAGSWALAGTARDASGTLSLLGLATAILFGAHILKRKGVTHILLFAAILCFCTPFLPFLLQMAKFIKLLKVRETIRRRFAMARQEKQ
jgi:hypothetical protein